MLLTANLGKSLIIDNLWNIYWFAIN